VKKPPPSATEHPSDLLLPYAEGLLTPIEKEVLEDHLRGCAQCASELEELRETIALLERNKEALCPEHWELYEYVHYGKDPRGLICRHLQQCEPCSETARELGEKISPEAMPDQVWASVKQRLPSTHRNAPSAEPDSETFIDRLYRLFRFPAIAVGVATAAVLAFVLLTPPQMPQSVMALSSVAWENAPKPKGLIPSAKRAAIVLTLKDFDPPWPRERIDALYEALAPPVEMYARFQIVPPRVVRESLDRSELRLAHTRALVDALAKKLSLAAVLVVTVTARGQGARVQVDLLDTSTGNVTYQKTEANIPWTNLDTAIRQLAFSALLPPEKGTEAQTK
jgi:hypothetical protein